jgi:hypothetical protein
MELIEEIAKAIWEDQRRRIGSQDGINARLKWRDKQVPDKFWDSYVNDAIAALEVINRVRRTVPLHQIDSRNQKLSIR